MDSSGDKIKFQPHHEQMSLCTTRPPYRQGRKLTAVKVYTVNDESVHLLIHGVPSIGLLSEVSMLCERYGRVKSVKLVDQYSPDQEEFTNVYHAHFERIQSARFAKKIIDTKSFFGGVLHVCYAPELETINETKLKLVNRKREIAKRTRHFTDDQATKSTNILTADVDEVSFKSSYEEKFSLGSSIGPNFINSSVPSTPACFPSTSQSINLSKQVSPVIRPTTSSSCFMTNTQPLNPASIGPEQIYDSTGQSIEKNVVSNIQTANMKNNRKRAHSAFNFNTQTLGSTATTPRLPEPSSALGTKKNMVPKTAALVKKCTPNPQKQSHPGPNINTRAPRPPVAPQEVYYLKPSTSQEVDKNMASKATATNDNNLNPLKRPIVGPIRFLPRSLSIKKKKT